MNKSETLTDAIGTMHSGGAELEEQRGEANQARKSAPHTVWWWIHREKQQQSVEPCCQACHGTKEAMPDQRQRDIWGVQHLGDAQHACQQEQPKARLFRTRHHVVWPVWCACKKQVMSGMQHIRMSHVADITEQRFC